MAVTQKDIDDLEKAIASGARKVKRGDREIEYRDLSEMKDVLTSMRNEISGTKRKAFRPVYQRGYQR